MSYFNENYMQWTLIGFQGILKASFVLFMYLNQLFIDEIEKSLVFGSQISCTLRLAGNAERR